MIEKIKKVFLPFSIRVSGNIVSKILSLVTLPFISRALGPVGYGDYNFIITLMTYLAILVNWGYASYGIRETAKKEDASQIVNKIISARFTLGLISVLIALLVLPIVFWQHKEMLINILIALGFIVAQFLNLDYYYYGKKRLLVPTISQLSGQIVFVIGVVLFIKRIEDLRILIILYVVYQLVSSLIMLFIYKRKTAISIRFSIKDSINSLKNTLLLGASGRIENLSYTYPILIIPLFFKTNYELGLYSSAFMFFTIILLVYQTIMIIIAPYLVDLRKKSFIIQRKIIIQLLGFLLLVGIVSSVLFLFTGERIIGLLFGKSFGAASPLIKLICYYLLPFWPITMVLGTILIYYDFDKYYLRSTILNAILILILVPVLIKLGGISGAIYATGIANFGVILIIIYYLKHLVPGLFKSRNVKHESIISIS